MKTVSYRRRQRGVTLLGLLFWAVLIGIVALVGMRVFPTLNEYWTIQRTVNKVAKEGNTVPEIRAAFERQKQIEYSISSISGKDLDITKINDKVVVYDRVRENLVRSKKAPLREIVDRSINETLSRTIGTSIALFLAIAPLALFGGPALREFALTLLFGLVLATSSSIFIAAPILLNIGERYLRRGAPAATSPEPTPATMNRA